MTATTATTDFEPDAKSTTSLGAFGVVLGMVAAVAIAAGGAVAMLPSPESIELAPQALTSTEMERSPDGVDTFNPMGERGA